jgi:membrane protein required for colicin V production
MNSLDIAILIVVLLFAALFGVKGFLKAVSGLLGFVVAYLAATRLMEAGASLLQQHAGLSPEIGQVVAYFIAFVLILILYKIIVSLILRSIKLEMLGPMNHIGGALFGAVFAVLLLSLIIGPMNLMSNNATIRTHTEYSRANPYLVSVFNGTMYFSDKVYPGFKAKFTSILKSLSGATSSLKLGGLSGGKSAKPDVPNKEDLRKFPKYYKEMFEELGIEVDSLDAVTLKELLNKK